MYEDQPGFRSSDKYNSTVVYLARKFWKPSKHQYGLFLAALFPRFPLAARVRFLEGLPSNPTCWKSIKGVFCHILRVIHKVPILIAFNYSKLQGHPLQSMRSSEGNQTLKMGSFSLFHMVNLFSLNFCPLFYFTLANFTNVSHIFMVH